MNKENVLIHTMKQVSLKNKGDSDARYYIDELEGHYAKRNKPVQKVKGCMIPLISKANPQEPKAVLWWPGAGAGE